MNLSIYFLKEDIIQLLQAQDMERESLIKKEERLSFNLRQEKITVKHFLILDPGPGSYRTPSDFGHYDG